MLKKIESLLNKFEKAHIKHMFRESNMCVDPLIKLQYKLDMILQCYPIAPRFIEKLLAEDIEEIYSSK